MVTQVDTAYVNLWGMLVGAVSWDPDKEYAIFEFDSKFLEKELDLSPIKMPIIEARRGTAKFEFRALSKETYRGLPGMLADALPDRFGSSIIDAWLARQGRTPESFSSVERLCYTGKRAMGALEFSPIINQEIERSVPVEVSELVELAQKVTMERSKLKGRFDREASDALLNIIRVGTSAGGIRPKAVIALNDKTKEVRSGQVDAPDGFDYWVLKFDGIKDESLGDPAGYGRIEYAYHKMAISSGIKMTECRLLEENGRAHFMTKRFDRTMDKGKLHMQSLCAMAHFDFNDPGAYSYEQAFQIMRELKLPYIDAEQQFRRMVFNVVARNQDDHTKNITFLMDKNGQWRLSPAYDVIYSYNPRGDYTSKHQMSINGKRDIFLKEDLISVGKEMNIKSSDRIIDEIVEVVSSWPNFAKDTGVEFSQIKSIGKSHRLL
ncbi:MAG: type II toxin-antitoxin system HipA family toxin [Desulfobacterales bacterium]|uniref:Type II toxin-antitoxin system HipA family toxin n=1 Tax=Candidatus Desulfatibia vada TaxID=2841696 RepID=A0A8J6NX91_9BACT|nr:type II toxin-antitoxin system HipA family toxin [Candidatus Desulfatibia vada]